MTPEIFREYDIRGVVGESLTDETVETLGLALGTYFCGHGARRIAIGYDARESSVRFQKLLVENLNRSGCDTVSIGLVPTPVLYYATFTGGVDGGVMITGSHNPPDHNGFKISLGTESLFGRQILEIGDIAAKGIFTAGAGSAEKRDDMLSRYCDEMVSRINLGPRKLKVVVDGGNGTGGMTAVPVYRRLGAEVVELYTDPDPTFPNHHADPTVEENLEDLVKSVRETRADIGIAFDGDGDRIGVCDEQGRIIWGDELLIPVAREVLREMPGATVIAEAKCSQTLFDDIEANGGEAIMWKAGHSIIKAKMKETGAALAGEMSGHMFFADRYYGFDDAAYAGARLLEMMSQSFKPFSSFFADLPKTFSTPEIRTPCPEERKFEIVAEIAAYFARGHRIITVDGARIVFENGWGLVRASNTQALLVSRFEANTPQNLEIIRSAIESKLREFI